jgi:PLP dependent protein
MSPANLERFPLVPPPLDSAEAPRWLTSEEIARFGPDPQASFAANLADVRSRITAACRRSGRNPADVRLLPISKTVPAEILRLASRIGIDEVGENKTQEAFAKHADLVDTGLRWTIIGHLQRNKVKLLTRFADEFHALDSLRLADALNRRLDSEGRDLDVFIQVNTSNERSKFGIAPEETMPFIANLSDFPRLRPRGLMTLALFSVEAERVRECFRLLRSLRDRVRDDHPQITGLSMGMTDDFEIAVEEGATVVRVGRAIFGPRPVGTTTCWPGLLLDANDTKNTGPVS